MGTGGVITSIWHCDVMEIIYTQLVVLIAGLVGGWRDESGEERNRPCDIMMVIIVSDLLRVNEM